MSDRPDLRRLIGLARPHAGRLAVAFVAGLFSTATIIAIPLITRAAIDGAVADGNQRRLVALAFGGLAIGVIRALANYVRRNQSGLVSVDIEADLRERLFAHLQGLPISFHDRSESGQLLARATGDLNAIRMFLGFALVFLAYLILTLVAVLVLLFSLSPLLAGVTLLLIVPFIASALIFNHRMERITRESREAMGEVSNVVEESAGGIRVLKAFGRESQAIERMNDAANDLLDINLVGVRIRSFYIPILSLIPNLVLVAILGIGGWQAIEGALSVGTLIAFNQALAQLVYPLRNVGFIMTSAQQAMAASTRVFEIFDTEPDITDAPDAVELPTIEGDVRFDEVSFTYPGSIMPALDRVSFSVAAGETVALVGLSGAGKSTIASLIPRFDDPDSGKVLIDGVDVRTVTISSLRREIGVVFDESVLFSATIAENIAFGRPEASDSEITAAARTAGAEEFISELADGYETRVGESGFSLSGGQRQRIALARALLFRPHILILDDPLSSVDVKTESEIEDRLRSLLRGRTTFLIAHRSSTVAMADRVMLIEDGRVTAEGTHVDLLVSCPAYRDVLAADLEGPLADIDTLVDLEGTTPS